MRISSHNLTHYLLDKGFLKSDHLFLGNYVISQSRMRNSFFIVRLGDAPGLFVKQVMNMKPMNTYLMQKSATVQYLFHNSELFPRIKPFLPEYHGYDPVNHVIVTEFIPDAKNLLDDYHAQKEAIVRDGELIADVMAAYHKDITKEIPENPSLQFLGQMVPWVLTIVDDTILPEDTVMQFVRSTPEIVDGLEKLRVQWKASSVIHGDIKLPNLISTTQEEIRAIKIIDWEITDLGDPLWDVAGLIQSYFVTHIANQVNAYPEVKMIQGKEYLSIQQLIPAIHAFWKQYAKNRNWRGGVEQNMLSKTALYTGARLIQSAQEVQAASANGPLESTSRKLLDLCHLIFTKTEDFISQIFKPS